MYKLQFQNRVGLLNSNEMHYEMNLNDHKYSHDSESVINQKVAALIATIILILFSISSIRSKMVELLLKAARNFSSIYFVDTTVFDNVLNKLESLICLLVRQQSDDMIIEPKIKNLPVPESKKISSKSELRNIVLPLAKDFVRTPGVHTREKSNDVDIEPTFLQDEDYPEKWMTYDPVKGLIYRRLLNQHQEGKLSDEAPKNPS